MNLLMPIPATANGRLHLGHIGGPMLRMDVLARHLRRLGEQVRIVSATDPFDSFVLLRALQENRSPEEVVSHWHALIERDLRAVGIDLDCFANLLTEPWATRNAEIIARLMDDLVAEGLAEVVREKFLYCPASDRWIVGAWLLGSCPTCGAGCASYFCEECGTHYRPEMLADARSRFGLDEGPVEWRELPCLYLRLPNTNELTRRMVEMGVPREFRDIVLRHIATQGPLLRLTQPGTWGVPYEVPGSPVPQVTFTYSVGVLAFWLLSAEMAGIEPGSESRSVASFGIDNSLPFLLGGLGMGLALRSVRPVDHVLLNHFHTLEGSKFSTSRGHVIWAEDMAAEAGSDAVRAYLVEVNPAHGTTDFARSAFWSYVDDVLVGQWEAAVHQAWSGPVGEADPLPQLEAQSRAMDPAHQDLIPALAAVHEWVHTATPTLAWLKGFALLAYPFTPEFATSVWQAIGGSGTPSTLVLDPASGSSVEDFTIRAPSVAPPRITFARSH